MIDTVDKKRKHYIFIVVLLAILAVLVLPNLIVSSMNKITESSARKLEMSGLTPVETVNSIIKTFPDGNTEVRLFRPANIANVPGRVLYCVEHGTFFNEHSGTLPIATAQKYGYLDSTAEISWGAIDGSCWPCEYHGTRTYPYLKCVDNHDDIVTKEGRYEPEVGYILTYPNMEDYTWAKQMAIWASNMNFGQWKEPGNELYYEALHYREFHNQTTQNGQKPKEPDINVTDETDKEQVKIKANYKEQTLTVGPFSIDYINGTYDKVTLGGISDMYLIGYNQENEVVKERIEIKKYINSDGIGNEPEYFEPNETDKSFVDYTKQVYPKGISAGEDTFQVQVENPNVELSADADPSEYVTKLKLHIEFKWMGVTETTICQMEAYYYTVLWRTHHTSHTHGSGEDIEWCYDCHGYSHLDPTRIQTHINLLQGERKLFKTELEIDADTPNGFPMTMDLGGKVWEDVPEGKEGLTDGIYEEGRDRILPNVKVTIYDEEGTMVKLLPSSEDTSDAQVMAKVNPTYTDERGDYLFKGLDPLRKYYVTFEYNGQVYLPTDYKKDDSQYNRVDWFWTSKGTEKPTDRESYDKTYSEIGSAPANYKVPSGSMQIAPLTNGYNEAFSQYDLMGFKMTENGDYDKKYEEENRLIDSFYTIEDGNIVEKNENQEGKISKAIKRFIIANRRSPEEEDMLKIYQEIANSTNNKEEMLKKMQFIEDTKIESYTKVRDVIKSSGTTRPNPGEGSSGGSNNGSVITTVDRNRLLKELKNAIKQIRIDYEYRIDRDNTVWDNQVVQTFTNIRQDVPIQNQVDVDVEEQVRNQFLNRLKNMIQKEIVNNYIPNYEKNMYSSEYELGNYLRRYIQNHYQEVWNQTGMKGENELIGFSVEVRDVIDINNELTYYVNNRPHIASWRIPEVIEDAMKKVKIYYNYQIEREHIWESEISHYFENIEENVDVKDEIDMYHRDQVREKFFATLQNMLQEDLRTNYIRNYQLNKSRYDLVNYLNDYIRTYYRYVWATIGTTGRHEIQMFNFKIVNKNTGREIKPEEIEFDDTVAVIRSINGNTGTNTNGGNTGPNSAKTGYDLYPIYDEIIINKTIDMKYDTAEEARSLEYDLAEEIIDNVIYKPIYPGQFYINQGLWRRQEVDLALRKDVLYAATRINGKTEVYSYNKRDDYTEEQKAELRRLRQIYEQNGRKEADYQAYLNKKAEFELANEKGYWQIQLRMRDYNNYYSGNYTKELYEADYSYRSTATNQAGTDKDLQLYVTYKITVRNASQSIVGEITELVDYYDRDYTYRDDLSWVMYKSSSQSNDLNEVNFTEADYYDTIAKNESGLTKSIADKNQAVRGSGGTTSSTIGRYERERSGDCRSDIVGYDGYQAVYIKGLEGKQLASGEEAYVYLTFEVNKSSGKIITDTDNSLKENYVEINGYKTYYKDGTSLPNDVTKGSGDVAGLIDVNSTPGNLCREDLQGNRYEKNFENDTDRAKSIKVVVREDFIRSINGTVWEDERKYNVSNTNAMIGDGIRQNGEVGVNGITVELVERLENGEQYVWQTTVSGSGTGRRRNVETGEWENYNYDFVDNGRGKYEFSKAITGNYFVRFRYGDTTRTANTDQNGGQNKTSYNGQDFKSTVYQKDMKTNTEIDGYSGYTGMKIDQYNGEYNGTSVGYYDIRQSDRLRESGSNFSDAKDLWNNATVKYVGGDEKTFIGRQQVMNYSNNNGNGVTNGLAEILASPYTTGKTDELIKNTQMTAVTGLIVLEGEYNRTDSDGYINVNNGSEFYDNANNGNYILNDVDFGLAERPKAQLELGKKITNVQIKLANGNILFDANKGMTDLMWTSGTPYMLNKVGMKDINSKQYQEFYSLDNHRYTYRTEKGKAVASVNKLVADRYKNNGNNGLIVATMDEELMQGANITISYLLTVTNVGETDYYNEEQEKAFAQRGTGESFYYKGTGADTIVRTKADVVTDYVANNLNFNENAKNNNQNSNTNKQNGWKVTDNALTTLGLNNNLATKVSQYNNVIHTNNLNKELAPTENTTVGLVLTQLINPENSTDDKTYDNVAEITTISNPVGRRMAYSIQGNQDPTADASKEGNFEVDSVKSERVTILPPFGIENIVIYIAIAVSVLVVLAGGIILIKKKVLNK